MFGFPSVARAIPPIRGSFARDSFGKQEGRQFEIIPRGGSRVAVSRLQYANCVKMPFDCVSSVRGFASDVGSRALENGGILMFTGMSTILVTCLSRAIVSVVGRLDGARVVEEQIELLVQAGRTAWGGRTIVNGG